MKKLSRKELADIYRNYSTFEEYMKDKKHNRHFTRLFWVPAIWLFFSFAEFDIYPWHWDALMRCFFVALVLLIVYHSLYDEDDHHKNQFFT
jgi:hypothetical protein